MTQIGFIRHGITDWNMAKRAQGHSDIPLNETGRSQARALAQRLREEQWDALYSSDLSRAKETAEIVGQALGLSVHTDTRLREMYCGEIEGTTVEERIERWGEGWHELSLGVEKEPSISDRGLSFAAYVAEKHPNQRVLVVSHGALIGYTLKRLIPHVNTEEHLHNTSITKVYWQDDRWECELYNCAKHVNDM
ncbi:histidine phosphatase family protein [Marinicrinis lubricantis]|uniref:Histidine phosphatase family protein n=1 Tax=Marinicrinis lubricantis TaxID=2086470 RepID=A0ABW1IRH0_9BACL